MSPQSGDLLVLATGEELDGIVDRLAADLSRSHPDGVLLVGVLKGSVCLLADLARRMTVAVTVDFLAVTPYVKDSGRIRMLKDLDNDISGLSVVLVEDIIDTGLTARYLREELLRRDPGSLRLLTLVDKPARRLVPLVIDHVGLVVPDVFVVGYGLDFAGRYRNLNGLWGADAASLASEPDLYLLDLYSGRSTSG